MKIYLVRHGATEANANKTHQYPHDPLSEEGLKQAKLLALNLKNQNIDIILSSPFKRTSQTAEIISRTINKKVEYSDLLKEVKRPSEIEGKSTEDEEVIKIKDIIFENAGNPNFKYSDEESFFDFRKRAVELLYELDKRVEENILIVTHGQFIAMLFCVISLGGNLEFNQYSKFKSILRINNTGITVFSYLNNEWKLLTWNDTNHL